MCPVCGYEDCDEVTADLKICNSCSHIFKEDIKSSSKTIEHERLDLSVSPLKDMQSLYDDIETGQTIYFKFPSMVLYGLELSPTDFYTHNRLHYFNQMSLSVLFKRSGFKIQKQVNYWHDDECITEVTVEKGE